MCTGCLFRGVSPWGCHMGLSPWGLLMPGVEIHLHYKLQSKEEKCYFVGEEKKEKCACIEQTTTLQAAWGALWLERFLEAGFSCTFCMQFPKLIDTFLHKACTAYVCCRRSWAPVRPSACYLVCVPRLLSFADLDLNSWEDEASCLICFFFSLYKSGCEHVWGQCISIASLLLQPW